MNRNPEISPILAQIISEDNKITVNRLTDKVSLRIEKNGQTTRGVYRYDVYPDMSVDVFGSYGFHINNKFREEEQKILERMGYKIKSIRP